MNRVNFARCSHVVVDVCSLHGTWFDRDELRRIVEFIRDGGLEAARTREMEELERRKRELQSARVAGTWDTSMDVPSRRDGLSIGISAAVDVLSRFFIK